MLSNSSHVLMLHLRSPAWWRGFRGALWLEVTTDTALPLGNDCTLQSCLSRCNHGPRYSSGSLRTSWDSLAFHQVPPLSRLPLCSTSSLTQGSEEGQGTGTVGVLGRAVTFLQFCSVLWIIMYKKLHILIYNVYII